MFLKSPWEGNYVNQNGWKILYYTNLLKKKSILPFSVGVGGRRTSINTVSRSEVQWHCWGQEGERILQPDTCHWRTRSKNAAAGSELEEFFARGLTPRWHLSEELGLLCWIQGQGMCQQQELALLTSPAAKVALGFDPSDIDIGGSRLG